MALVKNKVEDCIRPKIPASTEKRYNRKQRKKHGRKREILLIYSKLEKNDLGRELTVEKIVKIKI